MRCLQRGDNEHGIVEFAWALSSTVYFILTGAGFV
jgi:hypothetical protein